MNGADLRAAELSQAVTDLTNDGLGRLVSPALARTIASRVWDRAYASGRDDALLSLLTTEQMAARLGIHPSRVRALANARGVGWRTGRDLVFREDDVRLLEQRKPGRPASPRA